ncbi:MAG: hypothetical protein V3G42_13900 [Oscillospiraceae bacterium]
MRELKYGGLKCPECGGELKLCVGYEGLHEDAKRYDERYSNKWGWTVSLDCTECPRSYPVCKTPDYFYISEIA